MPSSESVDPRSAVRAHAVRTAFFLSALVLSSFLIAACGGDDDGDAAESAAKPPPPATDFPKADGRPLEQVLSAATEEGPVVTPAARVLRQGENRFSFGVFTLDREAIPDAEVAIYAAPRNLQGPAIGPFPARIDSLETEPAFVARTTASDPDAAKVVYLADIPLNQPGPWVFGALTKQGDGFGGSLVPTPSKVGQFDPPDVGDKAPVTDTDTAAENPDISDIDTRVPPSSMHEENLADVLGKKPVVLLFATPALCQSRICGPVVDVAEQVKRDYGDDVAFIHQEIYNDNDISKGSRPQVLDYNLPSEPWLFVIDRNGQITTAIEGAFSVEELEQAVQQVSDGPAA
jgi:hypothetical protein